MTDVKQPNETKTSAAITGIGAASLATVSVMLKCLYKVVEARAHATVTVATVIITTWRRHRLAISVGPSFRDIETEEQIAVQGGG